MTSKIFATFGVVLVLTFSADAQTRADQIREAIGNHVDGRKAPIFWSTPEACLEAEVFASYKPVFVDRAWLAKLEAMVKTGEAEEIFLQVDHCAREKTVKGDGVEWNRLPEGLKLYKHKGKFYDSRCGNIVYELIPVNQLAPSPPPPVTAAPQPPEPPEKVEVAPILSQGSCVVSPSSARALANTPFEFSVVVTDGGNQVLEQAWFVNGEPAGGGDKLSISGDGSAPILRVEFSWKDQLERWSYCSAELEVQPPPPTEVTTVKTKKHWPWYLWCIPHDKGSIWHAPVCAAPFIPLMIPGGLALVKLSAPAFVF